MENSSQKVVLVTVFHSLVSKNILNTDALRVLRDSDRYKIVLLVPRLKKDFFEQHYGHRNVVVAEIDMASMHTRNESWMHTIAKLLINTHYLRYKRQELLDLDCSVFGWARHIVRETFVRLFADRRFAIRLFHAIDARLASYTVFEKIFDTYAPDLVFSTDLFEQLGAQFIREAKHRGVKTVGMVRSWDNCFSKGLLRATPDVAIVNNAELQSQLVHIHGMCEEYIEVVGLPQFDRFITQSPEPRATFFEKHGLDPHKRLVLFAPAGRILSETDADICEMLLRAKADGKLPEDIQFFVRNHPHHPADLSKYEDSGDMVVQYPGQVLDARSHRETELTPDDQEFLRNILAHVDVLVWVATSLCLDALVYDVPEVVINFDGYAKKDYYHSVKRYHDEDHMKKMFLLKQFRVANNEQELIEHIALYLGNRACDASERRATQTQQLFRLDGHSGKRVAEVIERALP